MKETFTKNQWLLSYHSKLDFSKPTRIELREMEKAGVLKSTDGNVPHMLRSITKFPALPIPIEVQLEFCKDFVEEKGEKMSLYTNLLSDEIREETEEANKQLDSFYVVHTDSKLHQKIKTLGNNKFWLSRFCRMREGEQSFYITTTHGSTGIYASLVSAIYEGEGSPQEQLLSKKAIIHKYGKIVIVRP